MKKFALYTNYCCEDSYCDVYEIEDKDYRILEEFVKKYEKDTNEGFDWYDWDWITKHDYPQVYKLISENRFTKIITFDLPIGYPNKILEVDSELKKMNITLELDCTIC